MLKLFQSKRGMENENPLTVEKTIKQTGRLIKF